MKFQIFLPLLLSLLLAATTLAQSSFTREEYYIFFKKQFSLYSKTANVAYQKDRGFYIVAKQDINPEDQIISVPNKLALSGWDNFPMKKELFDVIKQTMFFKQGRLVQPFVLALRLMIEMKQNEDTAFQSVTEEDQDFWKYMLNYWKSKRIDDLFGWKDHQLDYYEKNSFPFDKDNYRRTFFEQFMQSLAQSPYKAQFYSDLNNFQEFQQWFSLIMTRAHIQPKEKWIKLKNIQPTNEEQANMKLNDLLFQGTEEVYTLIPLVDLINHHTPSLLNQTDRISFTFENKPTLQADHIQLQTAPRTNTIKSGSEVKITYKIELEPFFLLQYNGEQSQDNIFGNTILLLNNYFQQLNDNQFKVCLQIKCADPRRDSEPQLKHSGQAQIQYSFTKFSLNPYLLNLYRIQFIAKSIPNFENLQATQLNEIVKKIETKGMINYENELYSTLKYFGLANSYYNKGLPIEKDNEKIRSIISQVNYKDNEDLRRQLLTHQVAAQKKQVKQLHALYAAERGIDLIHRNMLSNFLPQLSSFEDMSKVKGDLLKFLTS